MASSPSLTDRDPPGAIMMIPRLKPDSSHLCPALLLVAVALIAAGACSSDTDTPAGGKDGGSADSLVDAGSGADDVGSVDAGGTADAGAADGAATDIGLPDDATDGDAGAPDPVDAGPAPCSGNDDCGKGEVCERATCNGTGVCVAPPATCGQKFEPVCGCGEQDFYNACEAAKAGVPVVKKGECKPPVKGCKIGAGDCATGTWCSATSCALATAGTCEPLPTACTEQADPVCGCDHKTYGNACAANAVGVSVQHKGPCKTDGPKSCGGFTGAQCGLSENCSMDGCAMAGAGTCVKVPSQCPINAAATAQCGCDGKTYNSECERLKAGVSKKSDGPC